MMIIKPSMEGINEDIRALFDISGINLSSAQIMYVITLADTMMQKITHKHDFTYKLTDDPVIQASVSRGVNLADSYDGDSVSQYLEYITHHCRLVHILFHEAFIDYRLRTDKPTAKLAKLAKPAKPTAKLPLPPTNRVVNVTDDSALVAQRKARLAMLE